MPTRLIAGFALFAATGAALSQTTPPPARSANAELLGSPDIIRPADYPANARKLRREGTVWFELDVDERGRVTACNVEKSSGHDELDRAACALYRARARFTPGRDSTGKATVTKDQRFVRWRISSTGLEATDLDSPRLIRPSQIIRPEDYPSDARRKHEQGTVTALLRVDSAGKLDSCTVEQSSGSAALDSRTCELLSTRGRFQPGRDERGTAVDGELRQRITWRMRDDLPPLVNSVTEFSYRYDAAGKINACRVSVRASGQPPQVSPCPPEETAKFPMNLNPRLANGRAALVVQQFVIVDQVKAEAPPPLTRNERLVSQDRLQLTVNRQGRVTGCEIVESFPSKADLCGKGSAVVGPVVVDSQPKDSATVSVIQRALFRYADAADAGPKLLNAGSLIAEEDYPPKAITDGAQGPVTVKLTVDGRGKVRTCAVRSSSGSPILDEATCRLVKERASFEPAVNNAGTPVASEFVQTIRWTFGSPAAPECTRDAADGPTDLCD